MVQWLRICLPRQGTQVWSLVWEDPTCRGAAKPMHLSYWACALEPASHNYWACMLQLLKPACLQPMLRNKRSHRNKKPMHHNKEYPRSPQLEKPHVQQRRPNTAKKKKKKVLLNLSENWGHKTIEQLEFQRETNPSKERQETQTLSPLAEHMRIRYSLWHK